MDSTFIADRIKDVQLLKNDSAEMWNDVVKKYPYFSIGQWLKYGIGHFQDKGDLQKLALFKNEPIEFINFVKAVENHRLKIVDEEMKNEELRIEDVGLKEIGEEIIDDELEEIRPVIDAPLPKEDQHHYEDFLETIRIETEEQKEEDILSLINDLPNTSIIDIPEIIVEDEDLHCIKIDDKSLIINTLEDFTNNSIELEDEDKSLMVMMSFTDWLKHFKQKTEAEKEEEKERKALKTAWQREKLSAAADEELDEIPEPIFKQAMDSISIESTLISESLAEILAKQGKKDKAIAMYKKLSLRNPEKSTYFADLINGLNSNND